MDLPDAKEAEAPAVNNDEPAAEIEEKPHDAFLKVIIAYKAAWGVSELAASFYVLTFIGSNPIDEAARLISVLQLDTGGTVAELILKGAGRVTTGAVIWAFLALFAIGVLNSVEAWGLHIRRRWAEWLAVISTGIFIPYELYEVVTDFTITWTAVLLMNSAIVYYLAKHKELFKSEQEAREAIDYDRTHPRR